MRAFIFPFLFLVSHSSVDHQPSPHFNFEPIAFGSSKLPETTGEWDMIPTVYVCPNAPVSRARVERAMSIWKRHGYETTGPIMNSTTPACLEGTYSFGNIVIDLNGQSFPDHPHPKAAATWTYYDKTTKEILGARIEIKEKWSTKERVLEHEFGHAFGWNHYARKYHLMHPVHDEGGWDTTGLKKKRK